MRILLAALLVCVFGLLAPPAAAAEGARYAVIVQGASGDPDYATQHRAWVDALAQLLRERCGIDAAHLILLTETPKAGEAARHGGERPGRVRPAGQRGEGRRPRVHHADWPRQRRRRRGEVQPGGAGSDGGGVERTAAAHSRLESRSSTAPVPVSRFWPACRARTASSSRPRTVSRSGTTRSFRRPSSRPCRRRTPTRTRTAASRCWRRLPTPRAW